MYKFSLFALLLFLQSFSIETLAENWQVGPGETYTLPSQVSGLVQNGDTVSIEAGEYLGDVCGWAAHNLLLRGINGLAHLNANGTAFQGKAIWVISGNNTRVENIEFSNCSVPDQNGAGIRQEGQHLWVSHCYFHHNENGILAGNADASRILIEHSEFGFNGFGDGYSHNIYINHVDTLIFRFNYSHHANVGHELKSRARVNLITYNRFSNEETGTASREIDIPNGGFALLLGNLVHQGPLGQNGNMIGFGGEGLTNDPPHVLAASHNTLINQRWGGSFFDITPETPMVILRGNLMAGPGNFLLQALSNTPDSSSNLLIPNLPGAGFSDLSQYHFQLTINSPALDLDNAPGTAGTLSLVPELEYVHPVQFQSRCISGAFDAGAYEFCNPTGFFYGQVRSNPIPESAGPWTDNPSFFLELFLSTGQLVYQGLSGSKYLQHLKKGNLYLFRLTCENHHRSGKWIPWQNLP